MPFRICGDSPDVRQRQLVGFLQVGVLAKRQAGPDFLKKVGDIVELELVEVPERGRRRQWELVEVLSDIRRCKGRTSAPSAELDVGIVNDLAAKDERYVEFRHGATPIVGR